MDDSREGRPWWLILITLHQTLLRTQLLTTVRAVQSDLSPHKTEAHRCLPAETHLCQIWASLAVLGRRLQWTDGVTGSFSPSVLHNVSKDYVMFGKIMTHIRITRYGHLIEGDAEALRSTDKPAGERTGEWLWRPGQSKGEGSSELAVRFTSHHHSTEQKKLLCWHKGSEFSTCLQSQVETWAGWQVLLPSKGSALGNLIFGFYRQLR